jgi:hypothetical protein
MTDLLIRNVADDVVRRIDAAAERQGLSRGEFLRREVTKVARSGVSVTRDELTHSLGLLADLDDESVMGQAW